MSEPNEEQIKLGKLILAEAKKQNDKVFKKWMKADWKRVVDELVYNEEALVKFQFQCLSLGQFSMAGSHIMGKESAQHLAAAAANARKLVTAYRKAEAIIKTN